MNNTLKLLYKLYDHLTQQDEYAKLTISESYFGGAYCIISGDSFFYQGWGVDIDAAIYDVINVYIGIKLDGNGETLYMELGDNTNE